MMKIQFFLAVCLCSFIINAQNTKPVVFNPEISYTQTFVDSLITGQKAIKPTELKKILESNSKLKGWVMYYQEMAKATSRVEKFDSVIYYANKALLQYKNLNIKRPIDESRLVSVYNSLGYAYEIQKDYKKAIKNYQEALTLEKKYPYKWKGYITAGIAALHQDMGNDSLALVYYKQAIADDNYMNVPQASVVTLTDTGDLYNNLENEDQAIKFYTKALEYSYEKKYYFNIAALHGKIGTIKYKQDSINQAIIYYKKAIQAKNDFGTGSYVEAKEDLQMFSSFIEIYEGNIFQGITNLKKIKNDYKSYKKITETTKNAIELIYKILSDAYVKLNDAKSLARLHKESSEFLQKHYQTQLREDLQKLEVEYQTREKDASIHQLEQNKTQQGIIIRQQRIIAFSLGGCLLLILLFGFLFWRQTKLKNQYEKANLEQRLLRSQMNPHFIGNAMNTINFLVSKNSDKTVSYVNKLSTLFRGILTNSREEFISLEDELITIDNYLELQSNFSQHFNYSIATDDTLHLEELIIPPMLIQPLIENAIIHGISSKKEQGQITIKINRDTSENLLKVHIQDNGNGIQLSSHPENKSISGNIIKERLYILKKKFKVNSRLEIFSNTNGTKVELFLPYIEDI